MIIGYIQITLINYIQNTVCPLSEGTYVDPEGG